ERLAEAARRVDRLSAASNTVLLARGESRVGLEAARRAVLAEGRVELTRPALVVELLPEPSIAAGRAGGGLADVLPGAAVVRDAARDRRRGRRRRAEARGPDGERAAAARGGAARPGGGALPPDGDDGEPDRDAPARAAGRAGARARARARADPRARRAGAARG